MNAAVMLFLKLVEFYFYLLFGKAFRRLRGGPPCAMPFYFSLFTLPTTPKCCGAAVLRRTSGQLWGRMGTTRALFACRAPSSELVRAAKAGHRVWRQQSGLPTRIYAL
jgi:hypothetical protein